MTDSLTDSLTDRLTDRLTLTAPNAPYTPALTLWAHLAAARFREGLGAAPVAPACDAWGKRWGEGLGGGQRERAQSVKVLCKKSVKLLSKSAKLLTVTGDDEVGDAAGLEKGRVHHAGVVRLRRRVSS